MGSVGHPTPSFIKADLADVKAMQLRMREDFNRFEGDLLRFERIEAGTQLRLDRIETRLNLTDAEYPPPSFAATAWH
jgi:hypothetical protein